VSTVERTSRIAAPATDVWERATSIEGVNHELGPWMRMTVPRHLRDATLADLPIGIRVARSWVLFLGVIPFDYDDLTLLEVEPGRRFLERSPMGSMRFWQHERVVEPDGGAACRVTDRLTFEPKLAASRGLVTRIVERIFAHRHRRLAAWFAR
jgi:ligand-binding SRPBCC domain-containing protein